MNTQSIQIRAQESEAKCKDFPFLRYINSRHLYYNYMLGEGVRTCHLASVEYIRTGPIKLPKNILCRFEHFPPV